VEEVRVEQSGAAAEPPPAKVGERGRNLAEARWRKALDQNRHAAFGPGREFITVARGV
jgi:hypothetical protein